MTEVLWFICSVCEWVEEVSEFLHREDLIQPGVFRFICNFTLKIPSAINIPFKLRLQYLTGPVLSIYTVSLLTIVYEWFFREEQLLIVLHLHLGSELSVDTVCCRKRWIILVFKFTINA